MLFFSESESNQDVKIVIVWYKGRRSAFKGSFALRSRVASGVTMMAFNIQGREKGICKLRLTFELWREKELFESGELIL